MRHPFGGGAACRVASGLNLWTVFRTYWNSNETELTTRWFFAARTGIPTADSTAVHDNETAALSLFEQPFCSGIQGAKVTLLRVQAIRRIAKFSGPTVGGQRIDRTGDLVTAKHNEERAGADTGGLWARRVVLGTLHEVTARHNGRGANNCHWAGGHS